MTNPSTSGTNRGIRRTVALLLVIIAVIVGSFVYSMVKPRVMNTEALRANNMFVFDRVRDIGNFSLQDDTGRAFVPKPPAPLISPSWPARRSLPSARSLRTPSSRRARPTPFSPLSFLKSRRGINHGFSGSC